MAATLAAASWLKDVTPAAALTLAPEETVATLQEAVLNLMEKRFLS